MSDKITQEDKLNYEKYISESLPAIKQLQEYLKDNGRELDFSPKSLKIVDDIISKNISKRKLTHKEEYEGKIEELSEQEKWFIVRLGYYITEVVIKNLGAHWELDKVKSSFSYKRPVLRIEKTTFKIEPMGLVLASAKNGKSIYEWYRFIEGKYKPK